MNVSLVYPLLSSERSRIDENKQYWPPLGLAYLAGMLRKNNHRVQIIDRDLVFRKEKLSLKAADAVTLEKIDSFGTELVGFSATTPNISDVKHVSSIIKSRSPNTLTVLGGPHVTGEPELTLRECSNIDLAVLGEGEETLLELAEGKQSGRIRGLAYRLPDSGRIILTECRPLIDDIDSIPRPSRDILDMDFYTRPSRFTSRNLSLRTTHIFTARGCPYYCTYCAGPLMGRRKVRFHSPERILEEVLELIGDYKIEAIYFAEDMFLSNRKRAEELLNLFIDNGINKRIVWMAQLSANSADSGLLKLMKKAGCIHVEYGFESGSQRVLDLMNKKSTVGENLVAAKLTRDVGIRFQGNFIVGYPGEKESDFNQTVDFIKKTRPDHISLNMFMPLPGTAVYAQLKKENRLLPGWDDIGNQDAPQLNYADMPRGRFEELYTKARLKVILPINLRNFLAANISNPARFFYVIFTQSFGLLLKVSRMLIKSAGLKGKTQ